MKKGPARRPIAERFWPKVDRDGPGGCWLWTAGTVHGYGSFAMPGMEGGKARAHRVAYEMLVGPIPEGLVLDHLCEVKACVNPAHLEPVTHAVNTQRGPRGRKTHCPHGHTLDGVRRDRAKDGSVRIRRYCRECKRVASATPR